jgi:hypothetical protein
MRYYIRMKISKSEIKAGTKHEMEHTKSKKVAKKIAMDHLKEHPLYYNKTEGLPAMEKKLQKIEHHHYHHHDKQEVIHKHKHEHEHKHKQEHGHKHTHKHEHKHDLKHGKLDGMYDGSRASELVMGE